MHTFFSSGVRRLRSWRKESGFVTQRKAGLEEKRKSGWCIRRQLKASVPMEQLKLFTN